MSGRHRTVAFAALLLCITAFGTYKLSTSEVSNTAKPPLMLSSFFAKAQYNRSIVVKLEAESAQSDNEPVKIRARLSMPFNFKQQIQYRWRLGEGVNLLSGETEGYVDGLEKDDEKSVEIVVSGFSKEQLHHIKFEAVGSAVGRYVMGESMLASDMEKTFENIVQNVERIKASK